MQRYPLDSTNVKFQEEIVAGLVTTTYIGRVNRGTQPLDPSVAYRSIMKIVETYDGVGTTTQEISLPVSLTTGIGSD